MRAGKLRHTVTVQQDTGTVNSSGQVVPSWVTYKTRRASIRPLSGREYIQAKAVNSEITHAVQMRYDSGITPKMRIAFRDRTFDIEAILNLDERNRYIELMCKESS